MTLLAKKFARNVQLRRSFRTTPSNESDRSIEDKAIAVVVSKKRGSGIGRIRLCHIKDVSADALLQFVRDAVELGAAIHTDD